MLGARPELRRALIALLVAVLVILVVVDLLRADSFLRSLFDPSEPPGRRIRRLLGQVERSRR